MPRRKFGKFRFGSRVARMPKKRISEYKRKEFEESRKLLRRHEYGFNSLSIKFADIIRTPPKHKLSSKQVHLISENIKATEQLIKSYVKERWRAQSFSQYSAEDRKELLHKIEALRNYKKFVERWLKLLEKDNYGV
ncbi:MAG: hypothetical protein Q7S21_01535 [archaeon]|nr:hypothetical protein [archaeon]